MNGSICFKIGGPNLSIHEFGSPGGKCLAVCVEVLQPNCLGVSETWTSLNTSTENSIIEQI